jgi:hypothetical protein
VSYRDPRQALLQQIERELSRMRELTIPSDALSDFAFDLRTLSMQYAAAAQGETQQLLALQEKVTQSLAQWTGIVERAEEKRLLEVEDNEGWYQATRDWPSISLGPGLTLGDPSTVHEPRARRVRVALREFLVREQSSRVPATRAFPNAGSPFDWQTQFDCRITEIPVRFLLADDLLRAAAWFPKSSFTLSLSPQTFATSFVHKWLLGMPDVEIGAAKFDEAYLIDTSKPEMATRLLCEPVRERLLRLGPAALTRLRIAGGRIDAMLHGAKADQARALGQVLVELVFRARRYAARDGLD